MTQTTDPERIEAETRAWVRHAVIGLGLCPFAAGVVAADRMRVVVVTAAEPGAALVALGNESRRLAQADPETLETTLLVLPNAYADFVDFNDALDDAEALLADLGLDGVLQVASFHPHYRFAGTTPDDVGNATNRAPHPIWHLLREDSVARAVQAWGDTDRIYEANIARLEALGAEGWAALRRRWTAPDP